MKVGIQAYSVMDDLNRDLEGTLRAIADAGFDCIEPCGFYDKSPEQFKALCDAVGLEICSAHIRAYEWDKPVSEIVEHYAKAGCRDIVFPCPKDLCWPGQPKFFEFIKYLDAFATEAKALGSNIHYHNHAPDILTINGKCALDTLLESKDIHPQFDCGWLEAAGVSAVDYIQRYSGRVKMLHLRDFWQSKHRNKVFVQYHENNQIVVYNECQSADFEARPLGHGLLDVPAVIKAARDAGVTHLIYENDPRGGNRFGMTPLEAAKTSCTYIKHCVAELGE